jgi:hypothetical protein
VVTVGTAAGATRVLKFTARSVDAINLDMTVGQGRSAMRLQARPATTSTLKGRGAQGVVTLYIRELSGNVVALDGAPLPGERSVAIAPDAVPPWLAHPVTPSPTVTFVSATVSQFTQFGGDLSITGPLFHAGAG